MSSQSRAPQSNGGAPTVDGRLSLRERRHTDNAREIEAAAIDLFTRQGFAATTSQQIASVAGMSQRTFFRYCPTKVDAVLSVSREMDANTAAGLSLLTPTERTASRVEDVFAAAVDALERDNSNSLSRLRTLRTLMLADPDLYGAIAPRAAPATASIAQQWSEDARGPRPEQVAAALRARLLVELAALTLSAAFDEWARRTDDSASLSLIYATARDTARAIHR